MPKTTIGAGDTYPEPTEQEYSDAMSRHGTDAFSADDEAVVARWQQARTRENELNKQADEANKLNAEAAKEVASSPGNSSSTSSPNKQKNNETNQNDSATAVPTTENLSPKGQTDSASASSTATNPKKAAEPKK